MLVRDKNLIYTFITYISLIYVNYKFDTHETLYINKSSYIQDYIIGLFFISFIIYCIVYIFNTILKYDDFNSDSIMSSWNQINTNGSLFIILVVLYFKIMPFNIVTFILLFNIIIIYYPLIEYANNFLYNESFSANINDLSRAIQYSIDPPLDSNQDVRYYIGLNQLDPSEIIINFKGTDTNKNYEVLSNLNIKTMEYKKDYASNPDIINELSSSIGIHSGYLKSYLSIKNNLYYKCKELLDNGANKIFISGYSLGAGLSTICTFDFHANLNKLNITANNINSVHIAGTAVGNHDFVTLYNKYVINSVRLVHLNDPVPRITDWLYKHTKNEYLVISNVYSIKAHELLTYDYCIVYNNNLYTYISGNLLIYSVVIIYVLYSVRRYYTQDIGETRHF
jgi:hypothetical protein